jgi:hypothetical protein
MIVPHHAGAAAHFGAREFFQRIPTFRAASAYEFWKFLQKKTPLTGS